MSPALRITFGTALIFGGTAINAAVIMDASTHDPYASSVQGITLREYAALTLKSDTPVAPPAPAVAAASDPLEEPGSSVDRKLIELTIDRLNLSRLRLNDDLPLCVRDRLDDILNEQPPVDTVAGDDDQTEVPLPDVIEPTPVTSTPVAGIPEPSSVALVGVAGLLAARRPRRT